MIRFLREVQGGRPAQRRGSECSADIDVDAHRRTCQVFNRRIAVLKVSSGCQDFARFSTCLRLLHEPLPNRKSASLLRQLTTESIAPTVKSTILLRSSVGFRYAFSMSIVSLFETVEGIGKPEERHFVSSLGRVSVCGVLLWHWQKLTAPVLYGRFADKESIICILAREKEIRTSRLLHDLQVSLAFMSLRIAHCAKCFLFVIRHKKALP